MQVQTPDFGCLVTTVLFMQLCYREPWTPLPLILPEVIAGLWAAALYFFFSAVADWEVSTTVHFLLGWQRV